MSQHVTTEKLFEDLQTVVRDAEALLKATSGQAGDKLQEVRAKAENSVRQARTRLESLENDAVKRTKEMAKEITGAAEGYVRSNPWQAVGVAAGVGLIVGLLLSRR